MHCAEVPMWGIWAPKIITQIGGCWAKISHGYDPGALIPAWSYQETKEKIGFQERSFGARYKLLVGGCVQNLLFLEVDFILQY